MMQRVRRIETGLPGHTSVEASTTCFTWQRPVLEAKDVFLLGKELGTGRLAIGEMGLEGSLLVSRGEDGLCVVLGEVSLGDLAAFTDLGPRWRKRKRQENDSSGIREVPTGTMRPMHGMAHESAKWPSWPPDRTVAWMRLR